MKNSRTNKRHPRGYGRVVCFFCSTRQSLFRTYNSVDAGHNCISMKKKTTTCFVKLIAKKRSALFSSTIFSIASVGTRRLSNAHECAGVDFCPLFVLLWCETVQVHQEGFVDGDKLLMEMISAGDVLASSLFSDLGGDALLRLDVALGAGSRPNGAHGSSGNVRVLPVFVFCLGDADGPLSGSSGNSDLHDSTARVQERTPKQGVRARLFEDSSPFKAEVGGDAVLVLQSEKSAPVPFYERQEMLRLPLMDATQAVVAGLLRGMHGTTAPDHWWPLEQQNAALDLTWAHGYHPFAPFGFGGSQPGELLAKVARRNAVVSRAAAVATTLAETAAVLEEFARAVLPSELLMAGLWTELCMDGAATREDWGLLLETAALSAGLPAILTQSATDVHRLLHGAVGDFERRLKTAKGGGLMTLVAVMDKQQNGAMSIYGQVRIGGLLT